MYPWCPGGLRLRLLRCSFWRVIQQERKSSFFLRTKAPVDRLFSPPTFFLRLLNFNFTFNFNSGLRNYLLTIPFFSPVHQPTYLFIYPSHTQDKKKKRTKKTMSSLRNAVHRRQHRERGQLEGREKWGILEKHKVRTIPFTPSQSWTLYQIRYPREEEKNLATNRLFFKIDRTTPSVRATTMPKRAN